jgi:hypothetical protein
MAHTSRCGGAKAIRCTCSCDKLLHGGGLGRLGISSHSTGRVARPVPEANTERPWDGRNKAVALVEDEITTWLAGALQDPRSVQAATSRALDQVDDLVGGAIVNTLTRNDHRVSRAGHELCDFLAALACAMKKFKDELDRYPD